VRYKIDGMWHDKLPMDRPTGDYLLATLKQLADLDYRQRNERQEGNFSGLWETRKYKFAVLCQPVASGERVAISIDLPRPKPTDLVQMGMREKMFERVKQFFKQPRGLIVSATLPGDGASMAWKGIKAAGDRFMADFVTLEQRGAVEDEVINVGSVLYDAPDQFGAELQKLLLREPDAVFFPRVTNPRVMRQIVELGLVTDRLMVVQLEARSALEALYRLQVLGMTPDEISQSLIGIVAQRLLRRLCGQCREMFEPDPATLAKLGIPAGRVRTFYKQFDPAAYTTVDSKGNAIPPPPCPACGGVGYFARLGLFEVLENDSVVKSILQQGKTFPEAVQLWRGARYPTFREEGVAAIALGLTSIEELQRVLRS
jgi:type II secretory ATPase GspE/PulE/Tfp pilus assembly ATPase PilB-like protein